MGKRPVRSAADHSRREIVRAVERRGMGILSERSRHVEGGESAVDAMPWRSVSRCPKAVKRERGGNLRRREVVRAGIPWMNPRERTRMNVVREGEPKARCQYTTKRAWGKTWREKRAFDAEREIGGDGTVKDHRSAEGSL